MDLEELVAALQALVDQAKNPDGTKRPMTEEEVTRCEDLNEKIDLAKRTIAIRSIAKAHATPITNNPRVTTRPREDEQNREFEQFIRQTAHTPYNLERRDQGENLGSAGGYLVPEGFRNKLVDAQLAFGGLASVVENIQTSTGNPLPWPSIDDTGNSGEIVQENGTFVGGADLAFTDNALNAYTYATCGASAAPLYLSWDLLQDSAFDLQSLITKKLGDRIARTQAPHLVSGTGVNQPMGILHGKTGVQSGQAASLKYADLLTYIHSVDPAYRTGASWAFNDTSLRVIEGIVDSNGDPMWRSMTSTMGDDPNTGTLMGFPYKIDQAFPSISLSSATVLWGVFGNLREGYVKRSVREVQLVVDPYSRASYRQTAFSAYARMDGTIQNSGAYIAMTCHA
jgi:HK97 family phage major capsid protein